MIVSDTKNATGSKNIDNRIKRRDEFISFLAFDDTCELIIKLSIAFLVILTVFFLVVAFGIAIFTDFNRFDLVWNIFKVFAGISLFTFTGMFITHIARTGREIVYEIRKYEIEKGNHNENNG